MSENKRKTGYKWDGTPIRKGVKGPSSTGKVKNVPANQTNWRRKLQRSRIKFDDDAKEVFLDSLRQDGLKGKAAKAAQISLETVRKHLDNDPDFAEATATALETYRDRLSSHAQNLIFEGTTEIRYNKEGGVASEIRRYPEGLILAELKRHIPEYRDKQPIDAVIQGGVIVAPAEMTPQEWIEKEQRQNEQRLLPPSAEGDEEQDQASSEEKS